MVLSFEASHILRHRERVKVRPFTKWKFGIDRKIFILIKNSFLLEAGYLMNFKKLKILLVIEIAYYIDMLALIARRCSGF